MTELPVLGDHLAVAAVAVAGIGAIVVYTAALAFARVLVTLIHIWETEKDSTEETECNVILQIHFTSGDCSLSKP